MYLFIYISRVQGLGIGVQVSGLRVCHWSQNTGMMSLVQPCQRCRCPGCENVLVAQLQADAQSVRTESYGLLHRYLH